MRENNTPGKKDNFFFAMAVMSILFFMIGFITTLNNSLIDFLSSSSWALSFSEKQLVNTAFFGAYLFSVPLSMLLDKLGYKNSAVLSLFVVCGGFALVTFSVSSGYYAFLASMFCVALGIALLQIVLNPYVLALGDEDKAASRLSLVGFFNSAATVLAPLCVALFVAGDSLPEVAAAKLRPDPTAVRGPFAIIAATALVLGAVLYLIRLPEIKSEAGQDGQEQRSWGELLRCPHLVFGAICIFVYMGVEVGIPSFLPDRMSALGMDQVSVLGLKLSGVGTLSIYWGGLMVGRLVGSIVMRWIDVRKMMLVCTTASAALLAVSLCVSGQLSIMLMLLCGFFHSIMWSSIFNLASANLGNGAKRASGIICTFAIGGAVLPPLMGFLQQGFGDQALTTGTKAALGCLLLMYAYIILFTARLSKIRKRNSSPTQ